MLEPALGLSIFDRLLAVLGLIREQQKLNDERADKALAAISKALVHTQIYIDARQLGLPRAPDQEKRIAMLWHEASIPMRYLDEELALRCFAKGTYWSQPDTWSDAQVAAKGIEIDRVRAATEALLSAQSKKS